MHTEAVAGLGKLFWDHVLFQDHIYQFNVVLFIYHNFKFKFKLLYLTTTKTISDGQQTAIEADCEKVVSAE